MLRRIIALFFIALALPTLSQSDPYESEELDFLTDFKKGVVLCPIDRIEGGVMQNSLESSRKRESNLALFHALDTSGISTYYFFYKEDIPKVEAGNLAGVLLDKQLNEVSNNALGDKPIFVITFLEAGHISYPEVRTFKKTKKGLKCDIRNLRPGPYQKRESDDHLRIIRADIRSVRWPSEEALNDQIDKLLIAETKSYKIFLKNETDSEYFRYRPSIDGDMFNRDFGRFPVMEVRRLQAHPLIINSSRHAIFHPKLEARIYPELSQWDTMERAIAEIERQVDQRLVKYKKVLEARARMEAPK